MPRESNVILQPDPGLGTALDYRTLRKLGLDAVIRTGSDTWTDYNEHDPGITILEVLTFALTDLAYRTGFRLEDILAQSKGVPEESVANQFHTCRETLTSEPVTCEDLRKRLIDRAEVQNAWVAPWRSPVNPIGGLVSVLADPDPSQWERFRCLDALNRRTFSELSGPVEQALADWTRVEAQLDGNPVPGSMVDAWLMVWGLPSTYGRELSGLLSSLARASRDWMDAFMQPLRWLIDRFPHLGEEERVGFIARSASTLLECPLLSSSAWEPVGLKGALDNIVGASRIRTGIVEQLRKTYYRDRSLVQDIGTVGLRRPVSVSFSFDWTPTVFFFNVPATTEIFTILEGFLVRFPRFEMLDTATRACQGARERVFEGPALSHGFLLESSMVDPPREFKGTDVGAAISRLPGVSNIARVRIAVSRCATPDIRPDWVDSVSFPADVRPELAPLECHQVRPSPDWRRVTGALEDHRRRKGAHKLSAARRDFPVPSGKYRDIEHYVTVQRDFPRIYRLEPNWPSPQEGETRLAYSRQLAAYLLFFDQILGNFLAQLSHLAALFSWSPMVARTRFFRGLEDAVDGFSDLIDGAPIALPDDAAGRRQILASLAQRYRDGLAHIREDRASFETRRNAFLDHMLSRFGRSLDEYVLHLRQDSDESHASGTIRIKEALLRGYPGLAAGRGKGEAFPGDKGTHVAPSGLRGWLAVTLDLASGRPEFREFGRRFIEGPSEGDDPSRPPTSRFVVRTSDGGPVDMRELTRFATIESNLAIRSPRSDETVYRVVLGGGVPPTRPLRTYEIAAGFQTADEAIEARREFCDFFKAYDRASERLELIEHVLLRPGNGADAYGVSLLGGDGRPWMETEGPYSLECLEAQLPSEPMSPVLYSIQGSAGTVLKRLRSDSTTPPEVVLPQDLKPDEAATFRFTIALVAGSSTQAWRVEMTVGSGKRSLDFDSIRTVPTEEDAESCIDRWVKSWLDGGSAAGPSWKPFCRLTPPVEGLPLPPAIAEDPYSFVATLVVPDWPSRFQDPRFKAALTSALASETPAHVWIRQLWLDHRQYQVFNGLHDEWKKSAAEPGASRDRAAAVLLDFLLFTGVTV